MTPMLTIADLTTLDDAPSTDDTLIDLLTPTDPSAMREMASFHANALLRHLLTITSQHNADDADWLADIQGCLMGIAEVLG